VNPHELTGQARTHVVAVADPPSTLHVHVVAPFMNLRRAARADGFDLRPVSGFRDFDHQLAIWNGKFSGERPLLDEAGRVIDASQMSPPERIAAILRWSALPGASRHHWGTDVDLIDANALAPGFRVQLTAEEYSDSGPFGPLAAWLGVHASRFGFFRPYRGILSGVQAEAWHFSFAPVAETARRALGPSVLKDALASADLKGKEHVLNRLDELHARYVAAIDWP
jgi:LAS superfamily LD-carboxypeptidase LdcB